MSREERLRKRLEVQEHRLKRAEQARGTLLSRALYVGTVGLLLVLPPVAGAYLGNWLDRRAGAYSVQWTISLILLGLGVGVFNVYRLIKE